MDPLLLKYYNRELKHVREMGGEFADEYPKIAGRLGLDGFECADPYVERLLEGFAFLAARVQLKLDAEFPRFTQHLLEMVYPDYLAPIPSMTVVHFQPDLDEGALAEGFPVPRGTVLRSLLGKGEQTACEYRTAHDVTLWPLEVVDAEYFSRDAASIAIPSRFRDVKALLRIRLRVTAGLDFDKLTLDRLPIFLRGREELPVQLYEQLMAHSVATIVRPATDNPAWQKVLRDNIHPHGFEDSEALLPYCKRSFQGYRLLTEYFAFYQRFLFVELSDLQSALCKCEENEVEIVVLFDRDEQTLDNVVDKSNLSLFCSPAVNLFPKRADSIHLNSRNNEYHVVPDRTRPLDLEVYRVTSVVGHGSNADSEREFLPFYASNDLAHSRTEGAYYAMNRVPRILSSKQRRQGPRSSYFGSETHLSLVDGRQAPYDSDLRLLTVDTLCTNRDLPLHMPVGKGPTDFTLESGAPVQSVRCLAGPTKPRPSIVHEGGETVWRLISHLSLNYLSLVDTSEHGGAAALRDLLSLYANLSEAGVKKQVDGVRSIECSPVTRRLPTTGPMTFGRGLQLTLTLDEESFEGCGEFLLAAVLERFFAKYVSLNSFTETVLRTVQRNEVHRWPMRGGRRQIL